MKLTPELKEIALRIIEDYDPEQRYFPYRSDFIEILEAVLAALPKPEPVTWLHERGGAKFFNLLDQQPNKGWIKTPLYTSPPATSELEEIHNQTTGGVAGFKALLSEYKELEAQNAALLVAIEAISGEWYWSASSGSADWVTRNGEIISAQSVAKLLQGISPSAELLEARDRKVIESFLLKFKRHVGGDGDFWLHELEDFYETGE